MHRERVRKNARGMRARMIAGRAGMRTAALSVTGSGHRVESSRETSAARGPTSIDPVARPVAVTRTGSRADGRPGGRPSPGRAAAADAVGPAQHSGAAPERPVRRHRAVTSVQRCGCLGRSRKNSWSGTSRVSANGAGCRRSHGFHGTGSSCRSSLSAPSRSRTAGDAREHYRRRECERNPFPEHSWNCIAEHDRHRRTRNGPGTARVPGPCSGSARTRPLQGRTRGPRARRPRRRSGRCRPRAPARPPRGSRCGRRPRAG